MKLIMTCWIWCKNGAFWTDYFRFAAKDNCGNKTHLVLQIHKYLKDPKSMLHLLSWNSCFWSKDVISVARGLVCLGFFWQTTIRRNREFRRVETIQVHWKRGRRQCWLSRWLIVGPLFPTRRELIVIVTFKWLFFLHLFKAMFRKTMENHGKPTCLAKLKPSIMENSGLSGILRLVGTGEQVGFTTRMPKTYNHL